MQGVTQGAPLLTWTLIPSWMNNYIQIKYGNGYVISYHTLLGMWCFVPIPVSSDKGVLAAFISTATVGDICQNMVLSYT